MRQRRSILYSGRVQGVGFRASTQAVAARFDVTGYVRNLEDGRVELVAEGAPAELEAFLTAVARKMAGYIDQKQADVRAASGEFAGFRIRSD